MNSEQMIDEGCPNVEPLPELNIDEAAPIIETVKIKCVKPTEPSVGLMDEQGEGIHPALSMNYKRDLKLDKEDPIVKVMAKEDVQHYDLMTVRPFLKTMNARLTRKRYADTSIREYLQQIQPIELAEQYLEFYDSHPEYKVVCAGAKHHHTWKGGLEQHVREMIGMGLDMMDLYPGDMTFTKSDFIISCFLHDFNKIWIYREITADDKARPNKFHEKQVFTYHKNGRADIMDDYSMILLELAKAGIVPSDIQWSAVLFHESAFSSAGWQYGGPSKAMDTVNTRNLLAVLVNMVDMYSSHFLGRSLV